MKNIKQIGRKPRSTIFLIALYAYHKKKLKDFTTRQLYDLADEAKVFYQSKATGFNEDFKDILKRNGYTEESWTKVLQVSTSFYFVPTPEMTNVNEEIKKLYRRHQPLINRIPFYRSYCSQLVRQTVIRNIFNYVNTDKRPYTYRINSKYLDVYSQTF